MNLPFTAPVELASRFVDVEHLPWEKTAYAGIEQKTLLVDKRDRPDHRADAHGARRAAAPPRAREDRADLRVGRRVALRRRESARPANSSGARRAAATRPGPGRKGGLFLAMFQIPNKFFQPDGRETDFLGNDWEAAWGSKP